MKLQELVCLSYDAALAGASYILSHIGIATARITKAHGSGIYLHSNTESKTDKGRIVTGHLQRQSFKKIIDSDQQQQIAAVMVFCLG